MKYPKTYHLPWSPGINRDDKILKDLSGFKSDLVLTIKMDGENTTMYRNYIHARSLDSMNHPSRSMVKRIHAQMAYHIPEGWRICGENLYAKHSIEYKNLDSYFQVFSIWNRDRCLSIDETLCWCEKLNLVHVPIMKRGKFDIKSVELPEKYNGDPTEGYVIRVAREFTIEEFHSVVGKYVRKGHVQTDEHWMTRKVTPNKLKRF